MGLIEGAPAFRVTVDGRDVSGPFLERRAGVAVTDYAGVESDQLVVRLVDVLPARLEVPRLGAELRVWIGRQPAPLYMGLFIADGVELRGPPSSMEIRARAAPLLVSTEGARPVTEQRSRSFPAGTTLGDLVSTIAEGLGLRPGVSAALGSRALPHLDQIDESDAHLLSRVARDLDAIFKIGDGRLIFARRGESLAVSGAPIPVTILRPEMVSGWSVEISNREPAGRVIARFRDLEAGVEDELVAGEGDPARRLPRTFASRDLALWAAEGELARAGRAGRSLSVTMPGEARIGAEGRVLLSGFRPDVDGEWVVTSARHEIDPARVFSTSFRAEVPQV